jgi:hypothetical protein
MVAAFPKNNPMFPAILRPQKHSRRGDHYQSLRASKLRSVKSRPMTGYIFIEFAFIEVALEPERRVLRCRSPRR